MFPIFYLLGAFFQIVSGFRTPVLGLSPSDLFIFSACAWLMMQVWMPLRGPRWVFPFHSLWLPACIVAVGGMIASVGAFNPNSSLWVTAKIWFVLAVWISMTIVMVQRGYLNHVLVTLFLAGVVTATVAVVDHFVPERLYVFFTGSDVNYWSRTAGTFGHPNSLGFFLGVVFPIGLGMLLTDWHVRRRMLVRGILALGCALMALALFYSGSVSSWVAAMLASSIIGAVYFWRAKARLRIVMLSLIGVSCLAGAVLLTQDSIREEAVAMAQRNLWRAATITGPDRLEVFDEAFAELDRNPIIGAGMDQASTGGAEELLTHWLIHNTILSGWQNGGILTLLGLLMAYGIVFLTALNALRYAFLARDWIALGLSASVFGWMFMDQTQPQLTFRVSWMTVALLFGMGLGVKWRAETPRPVPEMS